MPLRRRRIRWLSFKELRNVFRASIFFLLVNQVRGDERATTLSSILIAAATLMAVYGLTQSIAEGATFRVHGTMSIYMTFAGILMLSALVAAAQILFLPVAGGSLGWSARWRC